MDRIAEILGLTGAALAHRFGNKRQLFVAFARRQPSGVEDLITQQRQSHSDPLEAVIEFYVALVSAMTTRNEVANNLVMLNLDLTDNELGEQARLHAQTIKRCTADLLDETGIDNATDAAHHLYTIWNVQSSARPSTEPAPSTTGYDTTSHEHSPPTPRPDRPYQQTRIDSPPTRERHFFRTQCSPQRRFVGTPTTGQTFLDTALGGC